MQSNTSRIEEAKARVQASQERITRARLPRMTGGLNLGLPPQDIDLTQSPQVQNLRPLDGRLVVDTGYRAFGGTVSGIPQDTFQIFYTDGTSDTILITTTNLYYLVGGVWTAPLTGWVFDTTYSAGANVFVLDGTGAVVGVGQTVSITLDNGSTLVTQTTAVQMSIDVTVGVPGGDSINALAVPVTGWSFDTTYSAGATTFVLDESNFGAPLAVGQTLTIPLASGLTYQTVITSTQMTITTGDPVPSGRSVIGGSALNAPITLNGEVRIPVVCVTFVPYQWVIITNNVDPPLYFTRGVFGFLPINLPFAAIASSVRCQSLAVWNESLYMIGMQEGGVFFPYRVRASDAGNPSAFLTIAEGATTGIAAIYDLVDTDDPIQCAVPLGPWLILYRGNNIMRGTYLGVLNEVVFWEYMVLGEGVQSPRGVVPRQSLIGHDVAEHIVLGNFNVYTYRGDYNLTAIGDPIYQTYFGANGIVQQQYKSLFSLVYVGQWDEVWVLFCTQPNEVVPDQMLRRSLGEEKGWFLRSFNSGTGDNFLSVEPYYAAVAVPATQSIPQLLISAVTNAGVGVTYLYDYAQPQDNGSAINWVVQTKDVGDPQGVMSRYDRVVVYGTGTTSVDYSVDRGNTWIPLGVLAMGAVPQWQSLTLGQYVSISDYTRFRFCGNDPTFQLWWVEPWFEFEGEWQGALGQGGTPTPPAPLCDQFFPPPPPTPTPLIVYSIRTVIAGYTGPLAQIQGMDYYAVSPGVVNSPIDPSAPYGNLTALYDQGPYALHLYPYDGGFGGQGGPGGYIIFNMQSFGTIGYVNKVLFTSGNATVFLVRNQGD